MIEGGYNFKKLDNEIAEVNKVERCINAVTLAGVVDAFLQESSQYDVDCLDLRDNVMDVVLAWFDERKEELAENFRDLRPQTFPPKADLLERLRPILSLDRIHAEGVGLEFRRTKIIDHWVSEIYENLLKDIFGKRLTQEDKHKYYESRVGSPPHPILVDVIGRLREKGDALDLGCGAMVEAKYMIENGFHVTAVDEDRREEFLQSVDSDRMTFVCARIEDVEFPIDTYGLVSAMFVLPFVEKNKLAKVVRGIHQSLKKDGIFVGTFFGPEDYRRETFQGFRTMKKEEVRTQILAGLEVIVLDGEPELRRMDGELKLTHNFNFIARKT